MKEFTLTQKDYSILQKIVKGKNTDHLLVVTFDSETKPISKYDLHSTECEILEEQKLVEYIEVNSTPTERYWGDTIMRFETKNFAKVIPTKLGEFALEQFEKNEKRYRNSEIRSWVAVFISLVALVISILLK